MVWRIVSSPRYSVASPEVVMSEWTLDDVHDAHAVLDMLDELEALAREPQ